MIDLILRYVDGLGFLPIVEIDGIEHYRGEYKENAIDALQCCTDGMQKIREGLCENKLQ